MASRGRSHVEPVMWMMESAKQFDHARWRCEEVVVCRVRESGEARDEASQEWHEGVERSSERPSTTAHDDCTSWPAAPAPAWAAGATDPDPAQAAMVGGRSTICRTGPPGVLA